MYRRYLIALFTALILAGAAAFALSLGPDQGLALAMQEEGLAFSSAAIVPDSPPSDHDPGRVEVHAIPGSGGESLYVFASRVDGINNDVGASLNIGGSDHNPGHTDCNPGEGTCEFHFEQILQPGETSPAMTINVSGTQESEGRVLLGTSTFERRYVPGGKDDEFASLDNNMRLRIPNGALPLDSYLVLMDTVLPPGASPPGHQLVGKPYSIRASAALTESLTPLLLSMDYTDAGLGGADPHTLSIFFWDAFHQEWRDLESAPFGSATHSKNINRFGTYALLAGTTWRDTFRNYAAVSQRENICLAYGGRLNLCNPAEEGYAISVPISLPVAAKSWGLLNFEADIPDATSIRIDVLAEDGALLLENVADGASLSSIDLNQHSSLRLKATLSSNKPDVTPYLDEWSASWLVDAPPDTQSTYYLPLIAAGVSQFGTAADESHIENQNNFTSTAELENWQPAGLAGKTIDAVSLVADDPSVVYAAVSTNMWGIYKTTDAGEHWVSVYSGLPSHAVSTDPRRPQTVYAGEMSYIWKTVNGGETWTQIADFIRDYIRVFVIDPNNPTTVYAGTTMDVNTGLAGLYKSTNGGATWKHPLTGVDVHDIALHPNDSETLFLATSERYGDSGGILKSTDGGSNWTEVYAHNQVNAIAVHPFDGDIILAAVEGVGLVRSTDGGTTWQAVNEGISSFPVVRALIADPVHAGVFYAGTWEGGVFRSIDGGMTWQDFNEGLASTFIKSFAISADGLTLYAGTEGNGVYRRTVLPPPPPPGSTYAVVFDADGYLVEGAYVFQNGAMLTDTQGQPLTTNTIGNLVLEDVQPGDTVVAIKLVHEEPTVRAEHDGWAYRMYNTSMNVNLDGSVTGHQITASGPQTLTVTSPLALFNLLVSIQWDAQPEYMDEMEEAMRQASNYLFDVTDGLMALGEVTLYDNSQHWGKADMQVLARNTVHPYAYIGGLVSEDPADVIRVGRGWDRDAGPGPWDEKDGYRTLIHEFGHYALHLYDSYFEYLPNGEPNDAAVGCTKYREDYAAADDATGATIMNWQYDTSELSDRRITGLWNDTIPPDDYLERCQHTRQWQEHGMSDWEWLETKFADNANPPRWQFSRVSGDVLMPGPEALPENVLDFPTIHWQGVPYNVGLDAPLRNVLVLGPDGQPYTRGALVTLDAKRNNRTKHVDQGITAVSPNINTGWLTIYGAAEGDTLRAIYIDGSLSAQKNVGSDTQYTLKLRPAFTTQATNETILNPHIFIRPGYDDRQLTLFVRGVEVAPNVELRAWVAPPDDPLGDTLVLKPAPHGDGYIGMYDFAAVGTGLGSTSVGGRWPSLAPIELNVDFNLEYVNNNDAYDVYSPDGVTWLHLPAGSFDVDDNYLALMPTGAVPQPLPDGLEVIGNAYSLQASGNVTHTNLPGVLRMFYDPAQLETDMTPEDMSIARWDGYHETWHLLPGELSDRFFAISTTTNRFGIYALLAPAPEETPPAIYLPMLQKP